MIHVCFGLHDKTGRYSKFTGTAMLSLFANTSAEVTVHILHDNTLTQDNRDKFVYVAGRYSQRVKFYNVEELCADKLSEMVRLVPAVKTAHVSVGAFFRLLIPQILSADINKCIYLDSDIAVNRDIAELWRFDLGDKILAAVSEKVCGTDTDGLFLCKSGRIKSEEYFNSGVMLVNLEQMRKFEELILSGVKWRGEHTQCICFDQDILNYCFVERSLKLPSDFNVFVAHARRRKEPFGKKIYHYAGGITGGLALDTNDPFNRLWMDYFLKTPWFDADTFGRLFAGIRQMDINAKASMIYLSAIMSGKTRAFVSLPQNLDATKQIFAVRDDEEIISVESQESLSKMIDAMNQGRGKKIFFIMLPNFPFKILTDAGFEYGKDFLNGMEFLSEANGLMPLNSYSLIKSM